MHHLSLQTTASVLTPRHPFLAFFPSQLLQDLPQPLTEESRSAIGIRFRGGAEISISGVKSRIRVAEWFHIMQQPVGERALRRVSRVLCGNELTQRSASPTPATWKTNKHVDRLRSRTQTILRSFVPVVR